LFLGRKVEGDGIDAGNFEFGAAVGTGDDFAFERAAVKGDRARTFGAFGGRLGRGRADRAGLGEHGLDPPWVVCLQVFPASQSEVKNRKRASGSTPTDVLYPSVWNCVSA